MISNPNKNINISSNQQKKQMFNSNDDDEQNDFDNKSKVHI